MGGGLARHIKKLARKRESDYSEDRTDWPEEKSL